MANSPPRRSTQPRSSRNSVHRAQSSSTCPRRRQQPSPRRAPKNNMWHTDWIEILGFITGALCVWLLVKENIWNWPIGISNNIFFIIIFYKSGLFADAGLQFVYIAIAIYGWWNWMHGGLQHGELEVKTASSSGIAAYLAMAVAATVVLYWVLR